MNIIIKKWIEPYVLLETSKKHFEMEDFTFDGFTKDGVKADFLKKLSKKDGTAFGLYMKNVNKFYLFSSSEKSDVENDLLKTVLNFTTADYELTEDNDTPFSLVDLGKAEAGIILAE